MVLCHFLHAVVQMKPACYWIYIYTVRELFWTKCSLQARKASIFTVPCVQPYLFCESPNEKNHRIIYAGRDGVEHTLSWIVNKAINSLGHGIDPWGRALAISCQLDFVLLVTILWAQRFSQISTHLMSTYPTQISPIWQQEYCRKHYKRPH